MPVTQNSRACSNPLSIKTTHTGSFSSISNSHTTSQPSLKTLHARLGHSSLSRMKHIAPSLCSHVSEFFCEECVFAKYHRTPFPRSESKSS